MSNIFLAVAGMLYIEVAECALIPPASPGYLDREPPVILIVVLDVTGCCSELLVELIIGGNRQGVEINDCIRFVPKYLVFIPVDEPGD